MRFLQGARVILVLLQISPFLSFGKWNPEKCLRVRSLDAGTSLSPRCSVNSSNHSGKSRNRFPDASTLSLFVGLRDRLPDAGTLVLSLHFVAGRDEVPSYVSCGSDMDDELALELEEPVTNPGQQSAKLSVLHRSLLPFWVSCGF